MDYKIENIEIKTAKNQSEYVSLTLVNAEDEWDEPFSVPVWNDIQIKRYKALLASPEVMGDVNKIPESKRIFKYGFWEHVQLPEPMFRLWNQDVESTKMVNGVATKIIHKEGTPILDRNGNPVVYTDFMVFTKKTLDNNTQELTYAKGWSLTERANQMIAHQFTRATTAPQASAQIPEGPAPVAQQAPIQPAPVQPAPVQPAPVAGVAPQAQPAAPIVQQSKSSRPFPVWDWFGGLLFFNTSSSS